MILRLLHGVVLSAALICSATQLAHAEEQSKEHPYLTEKFFIDVGIFYPERQFNISVDSTIPGPSDPIDFDAEIGARKSDELFSVNFGWRFGQKWQLETQYFAASGSRGSGFGRRRGMGGYRIPGGFGCEGGSRLLCYQDFFCATL